MKVEESCNDSHLVDIKLSKKDIEQIIKGKFIFFQCVKDESVEIFIGME